MSRSIFSTHTRYARQAPNFKHFDFSVRDFIDKQFKMHKGSVQRFVSSYGSHNIIVPDLGRKLTARLIFALTISITCATERKIYSQNGRLELHFLFQKIN